LPTTEHGQLFLRLYENAIRCLTGAAEAWRDDRAEEALSSLRQAVEILRELDAGVDLPSGQQAAADLHRIYGFLLEQCGRVEKTGDLLLLRETTGLLEELHQSWKAITC
jgi:flagellin-specific chaperone FliS